MSIYWAWKKAFDFIRAGQHFGFYVKVGDTTFIEVFAENGVPNLERPLIKHFCLQVKDIDAVVAKLAERGVRGLAKEDGRRQQLAGLDHRPEWRSH